MSEIRAKDGDTVRVHYTGKLADGSVFDSSEGSEGPLEFTVGMGEVIPGFDRAVVGMKVGERKTITVGPEEAYGQRREDLLLKVDRQELPPQINPEVGMGLRMRTASGRFIPVRITTVTDQDITIDANHPLAGEELTFDIELAEVL